MEQAWELNPKYFKGMEELAEGFAETTRWRVSASYTLFLNDIADQDSIVPGWS